MFKVVGATQDGQTPPKTTTTDLLTVAVGGDNQIYVAVSPPADLIDSVAGDDFIKALKVAAEEGVFDNATGKFTS